VAVCKGAEGRGVDRRKGEDPTGGARVAVEEGEGKEKRAAGGAWAGEKCRLAALLGSTCRKEREMCWGGFSFFLTFPFKTLSKLKLFSNFKHLKPFQNFHIILKTFKTSHK
jgi:hypothetical protein